MYSILLVCNDIRMQRYTFQGPRSIVTLYKWSLHCLPETHMLRKTRNSSKVHSRYSKLWGLFFTSSNYLKCKLIWTCKKVSNAKAWLEKAIKAYFDSDRRFESRRIDISEFDISRVDCIWNAFTLPVPTKMRCCAIVIITNEYMY